MTAALLRVSALCACLLCGLAAGAQAVLAESGAAPLRPLDEMIEDVNPLSASLRNVEIGLRQTGPFDQVFRFGGPNGKLMRVQGALHAVFDQSIYAENGTSAQALVPGNTVFWIGAPPEAAAAGPAEPRSFPGRIETLIVPMRPDDSTDTPPVETGPASNAGPLTREAPGRSTAGRIVWDGDYRASRLRALMHSAAQAVEARGNAG